MAEELLERAEIEHVLGLEHDADDAQVAGLIKRAQGIMESYIGTPVDPATYTDHLDGGHVRLHLTHFPVSEVVKVTDTKGTTDDAGDDDEITDYRLEPAKGTLVRTTSNGHPKEWKTGIRRFKVEYKAGLSAYTDWTFVQHALSQSLVDLVVWLYENPDAGLTDDAVGQGIRRITIANKVPQRITDAWDAYTPIHF